ncbi:hypothetical protein [Rhizorhabdus dicambivorans]|uniref:Uncharacterized protein n=1 Tax=Rhizorhabdus dicambivorans TaxID=1850238 RepID=A0A2A4G2V3_9SPHN|nr:hypothetical protein [Rhizorhabdus dicambivorans]ATE64818.1 hypothetical protein CMV14_10755 [Rhizorhabdus dicambivorans]PCE44093.1 hypothetical protein COO09_00140 [Rhizorhabdus dicambivorans]
MVLTKSKRRSSLVMGLLLAMLLGVAAAFFVLAMPIRMLETVTTLTRLSKLMVQAEPPISPNDRTLLAVLAGIVTAGIGWVLVDWLLFGRAGMSRLIRTREDDYEDEDEDAYRPTDPLDLVVPGAARANDWSQAPSGDARRPLSARTDIGEPAPFAPPSPFGAPSPVPGLNQPLPPLGQILPGAGVSAPPLQPHVPPLAQPIAPPDPFAAPPAVPAWTVPAAEGAPPLNANFDLPDRPVSFDAAPVAAAPAAVSSGMPSWLPAPGSRPDDPAVFDVPLAAELPAAAPGEPVPMPAPASVPAPRAADPFGAAPAEPPPLQPPPLQPLASDPPPLILAQPAPPLPIPQAEPPSFATPAAAPAVPPVAPAPPPQPQQPVFAPEPPQQPFFAPPTPPRAPAPAAATPAPAPARPAAAPGFDRAQLEDLLGRLESKVHSRRAAAAAAASAAAPPVAPAFAQAPVPQARFAQPPGAMDPIPLQRAELPSGFAAPPPQGQPIPAAAYDMPVAQPSPAFNLGIQPQAQPSAPPPVAAPAPAISPVALPRIDEARKEEMLDQPLHVTLDLLRDMVRR